MLILWDLYGHNTKQLQNWNTKTKTYSGGWGRRQDPGSAFGDDLMMVYHGAAQNLCMQTNITRFNWTCGDNDKQQHTKKWKMHTSMEEKDLVC